METKAGSTIWTGDGRQLRLETLLKSGGAGSVYRLLGSTSEVAKIYHAHVDHAHYARKIEAMLKLSPKLPDLSDGGRSYVQIAWPEATLRDKQGKFLGFLMPAVDVRATSELECILQEKQARALKLPTGLGAKITLAANLAAVIAELHAQRHYVVDLKPVNLRFYPQSLYMAMLDCDGFSIQGQGERFAAPQITPDYLAPEFQRKTLTPAGEEQQDRFALAVVVFQLLNFGLHPYSGRPKSDALATDIPGRIAQRAYAYGLRANAHQLPNMSSGHLCMPMDLRTMFDRAFAGADAGRPAAVEWRSLLTGYAQRTSQRLILCKRNAEHQHYAGQACASCERLALLAKARAAPKPESTKAWTPAMARAQRTRPNPFARSPAPPASTAYPRPPVQPRARRPMPYVPLPRISQPTPPSLPWQIAAWFFGLLFSNPRATVFVFALLFVLFVNSRGGTSDTRNERDRDRSIPVETSGSQETPVLSDPQPILETAPPVPSTDDAATLLDEEAPVVRGPSSTELSATESALRNAANGIADRNQRDYTQAMTVLFATVHRRSSSDGFAAAQYDREYRNYIRNSRSRSQLVRDALTQDLEESLRQHPLAAEPAFMLGCMKLAGGDRQGAREFFVRAIWADPTHGAAWYAYGAIAWDDSTAIGAMANANVLSGSGGFASQVPPNLLQAANVDAARVGRLATSASRLAQQDSWDAARTAAEWNGRVAADGN